jgi:hypothetical protein
VGERTWTEDPTGSWVYGVPTEQQPAELAAFDPNDPVDHTLAAPGPPNVDGLVVDDTLVACPTCGTGVHPDRIRG